MSKYYRKLTLSIIVLLFSTISAISQQYNCDVTSIAYPQVVCAGDAVTLSASGGCGFTPYSQLEFSNWNKINTNFFQTNPCGPGLNGFHFWLNPTDSTFRGMESDGVHIPMKGFMVKWFMRYGREKDTGLCNAPDWPDEGVHLQYSTDSGATWQNFNTPNTEPVGSLATMPPYFTQTPGSGTYWQPYFHPADQQASELYYWHEYVSTVPDAAVSPHTKFRLVQFSNSGRGYDTWGVDGNGYGMWNSGSYFELIYPHNNQIQVEWSHGPKVLNPPAVSLPAKGQQPYDTCFYVTVHSAVASATDTNCVTVNPIPSAKIGHQWLSSDEILYWDATNHPAPANFVREWKFGPEATPQTSSDSAVQVTYDAPGNYSTWLNIQRDGCKGFDHIEVNITGMPGEYAIEKTKVYPTPSKGILTIELPQETNIKEKLNIKILNSTGQMILQKKAKYQKEIQLDLDNLASGIYILIIKGESIHLNRKIIVQ